MELSHALHYPCRLLRHEADHCVCGKPPIRLEVGRWATRAASELADGAEDIGWVGTRRVGGLGVQLCKGAGGRKGGDCGEVARGEEGRARGAYYAVGGRGRQLGAGGHCESGWGERCDGARVQQLWTKVEGT